ncbi:hypothetical protein QBC44DRAFT_240138 [Cladorrhinum sp. PSN332]|nr:hypothetical protein QBC44DRAFT_240138 [Cladorrhinum sp. PSN332]
MQRSHPGDDSWTTVGQRRGASDLARSALSLDLNWARADSESAARQRSYPSPPMSGSPSLPKASQEATERSLGGYQATTQDVYRGIPATHGHERTQMAVAPAPSRQFFTDVPERTPFPFPRLDRPPSQQLSYSQQPGQLSIEPPPSYLPNPSMGSVLGPPGPLSTPQAYPAPHHQSIEEPHQHSSPKQRKTKGHVASACVPCKKAHLRCTSQNKADQCIDVQHKKRGRPRLRDESQQRFGNPAEIARRPLSSVYGPGSSMGMVSTDNLRRPHSYRVLKSQPAEPIRPRFPERALGSLASDVNVIPPPPLSISTARPPEDLVAYLTLTPTLVFLKASGAFFNAIGRSSIFRMPLAEVLMVADRIKPNRIADQMKDEQKRRSGTSMRIPPILTLDEQMNAVHNLGFTTDVVSRYALNWMEHLTFVGDDGGQRPFPVRMGLASEDSILFVVLVLQTPPQRPYRYQYPTPSPNPRELTYPTYQQSQSAYSQTTPQSATFDPRQSGLGDIPYGARQGAPSGSLQHMPAGPSPGLPPTYSSSSQSRQPPPYPSASSSYQVPRSELQPASYPPLTAGYQLPPLSSLGPSSSTSQEQQELPPLYHSSREERHRVDIGGLIDRPDPPPYNPPQ